MADDTRRRDRSRAESLAVLARAAGIGLVAGAILVAGLALAGWSADEASATAFSLAALVFGFGLTAWSGTLLLAETLAGAHAALDRDWSAADTRQAMAVLAVIGAAGMVGAAVATIALGA